VPDADCFQEINRALKSHVWATQHSAALISDAQVRILPPQRSLTPHERSALEISRYSVAGLFVTNHCGDIDLEEHAGYGKATDHEKRIGRDRTVAVRLASTLRNIRLIANIGDVDHLFDCIRQ
jgi:hypothetical protein